MAAVVKRAGVLSAEALAGLRRLSRKMAWHPRSEDVWHLLDTVDAHRLVVDRYEEGWRPNYDRGEPLGSWWWPTDPARVEPMSQVEQRVVYDRVVDSSAPQWPTFVTASGRVLTEEDLEALVAEAEVGYDVSHLEEP